MAWDPLMVLRDQEPMQAWKLLVPGGEEQLSTYKSVLDTTHTACLGSTSGHQVRKVTVSSYGADVLEGGNRQKLGRPLPLPPPNQVNM